MKFKLTNFKMKEKKLRCSRKLNSAHLINYVPKYMGLKECCHWQNFEHASISLT